MAKNNKLINSMLEVARRNREEQIRAASERDTPQIYAAIAIALWKTLDMDNDEEKYEAIETVFACSQTLWIECVSKNIDIVQLCEKITGFSVEGAKDE